MPCAPMANGGYGLPRPLHSRCATVLRLRALSDCSQVVPSALRTIRTLDNSSPENKADGPKPVSEGCALTSSRSLKEGDSYDGR